MSILNRVAIHRFRAPQPPGFFSPNHIPKPIPFFQFHFSSSSSYSSSFSSTDDFPSGEFNFEPLTGFKKFLVTLKTMVALPSERIQHGTVLKLTLHGEISDQLTNGKCITLPQICDNFLKAAYDPRISAVYLHIHSLNCGCGWAKLDEIRRQISNFKKSGKTVVAYIPVIQPEGYYIACACDEIFAPPSARVQLFGFSVNNHSFGSGFLHNRYDNFEDSREALTALLDNIYSNWVDKVSSSTNKKREEVDNFILKGLHELDKLKEEDFISNIAYDDEVVTLLKERLGVKSFPMIPFCKYSKVRKWTVGLSDGNILMAKELIAIIRVTGTISSKRVKHADVVAEDFIKEIRMLKASTKVRAVIIRIDCAHHHISTAKLMWEEIRSLAAQKPVIASMSDVAASAGYYLAMGAGIIVAENLTLTGLIGEEVSQNYNLENHYHGIDEKEIIRRGELNEILKDKVLKVEENSYIQFLGNAALSRSMIIDEMEDVAHGRVWTGKDATSHGLVDAIGGISRAIAIAKLKANIPQNRQVTLLEVSRSGPTLNMLVRGVGFALIGDHQLLDELLEDITHSDGAPMQENVDKYPSATPFQHLGSL